MTTRDPQTEEEAIRWIVRLRDAGAADWIEFTQWLETSPDHVAAYNEIALADQDAGALPRRKPAAITSFRPGRPERNRRRRAFPGWGLGAAAAAAVLAVGVVTTRPDDSSFVVATAAGEQRSIQLVDGSRIDLNGSTRLILDRDQPRFAQLDEGEALFTVVHHASSPFQVRAGDDLIHDVGTVFNVVTTDREVRVAVAEGEVMFNPKKEAVSLTPGMSLEKSHQGVSVTNGPPGAATAWREGRLVYSDATIAHVAADLARNLGVSIRVDPGVSGRRFSGVLRLDSSDDLVLRRASALLDVRAKRLDGGWILTSE